MMTNQTIIKPLAEQGKSARVLIISDAAPHRNGVGAYYADLVDELSRSVQAIEILSPEIVDDKWQGGWMFPLPGDKTQKFCFPNAFDIQKKIREFNPTAIVVPTPGLFGLFGAMFARRYGIQVIVGFHTWFEKLASLYWNRVQGGLTKTYFEWVNKALFKFADRVLANSREMVQIAEENGAPNVSLMGTPLSKELIDQPLAHVPKHIRKILFVGRLAAEKNIDAIIDAAEKLPGLQFSIAGDGPERERLEAKVKNLRNVEMLGWVGRDQITHLIDSHDVLVLPSKVESFGTVAMEAMMRQRVVAVSSACGITEWPGLRRGLAVIEESSTLAEKLDEAQGLSEFEIFGRCLLARKAALEHIEWNKNLWLSCINESQPAKPYSLRESLLNVVTRIKD